MGDAESKIRKKSKYVVLLSTGSYNPVHKMHIGVFDLVAQHLESKGLAVVGGFISPSHDDYFSGKFHGKEFIPAVIRAELCRLECLDHPFLRVSTWELEQARFVDFPYVARPHHEFLQKRFNG